MSQTPGDFSAQARLTLHKAFERFSATVTAEDHRQFSSTELKDVRDAALQIESQLSTRGALRNMRRLQPLLQGLEHYSKAIEVLCNGTPYLPWIWAPIKLMLQVSFDYLKAFESLIEAYGKIADALPRFDRLHSALKMDYNFQMVLAFFYEDILEFHRRAYKFLRRKSWQIFFGSMWAQFDFRFDAILKSLAYHSDLVDREAVAAHITEAKERREQQSEQWNKIEKDRNASQLSRVVSWLGLDGTPQEDEIHRISKASLPNSCDWMINHTKTKLWIEDNPSNPLIWLYGKPGGGKSVLCANLAKSVQPQKPNTFYYFFNYRDNAAKSSIYLLRSLVAQAVQRNPDVVAYVHEEYVMSHLVASLKALRELLPEVLSSFSSSRIIVDGVDECDPKEQKLIVEDVLRLLSVNTSSHICKIFISTRDVPTISQSLRKQAKDAVSISLNNERGAVGDSIELFIQTRLSEVQNELDYLDPNGAVWHNIRHTLATKANGMFLWVSLVLESIPETVHSPKELQEIVEILPSGLPELYARIFERICDRTQPAKCQKASRILKWIACSRRALRKFELLPALALNSEITFPDSNSIPIPQILEICKPLVEERPDGSVTFVHFSVQEFLTKMSDPIVVREIDANYDISFACITVLIMGLNLIHPKTTEENRLLQVGSGIYGLIPYAIEHWISHLLLLASSGAVLEQNHPLPMHLSILLYKHMELLQYPEFCTGQSEPPDEQNSQGELDTRLTLLSHLPIHKLIEEILRIRWLSEQRSSENGSDAEKYALNYDRTVFTRMRIIFDELAFMLLAKEHMPGLSRDRLEAFKHSYAATAFRCRYPFCSDASIGLASDQLRIQHEEQHLRRVFCKEPDCSWNRIGFKSKKRLNAHMRNHWEEKLISIPPQVRRSRDDQVRGSSVDSSAFKTEDQATLPDESYPHSTQMVQDAPRSLADLTLDDVPATHRQVGSGWSCIHAPWLRRELEVDVLQTKFYPDAVNCVHVSSNERYVAIGHGPFAEIFEARTGHLGHVFDQSERKNFVCSVRFSPDSELLAIALDGGEIQIRNLSTQQIQYMFESYSPISGHIEFALDGSMIAACAYKAVHVWGLTAHAQHHEYLAEALVSSIAFSPDSSYIAAGCFDKNFYIWDISTGSLCNALEQESDHTSPIFSITFAPDGQSLFTSSFDLSIKQWDIRDLYSGRRPAGILCLQVFSSGTSLWLSTAIMSDKVYLFSGTSTGVGIWDPLTGQAKLYLKAHDSSEYYEAQAGV
ncbi:MAG: hypothetical protein M1821_000454 [Bathelium mastoideum]|nr:MAG: hypothetical protein M1821_000454 [Bathelium mastoideum]